MIKYRRDWRNRRTMVNRCQETQHSPDIDGCGGTIAILPRLFIAAGVLEPHIPPFTAINMRPLYALSFRVCNR